MFFQHNSNLVAPYQILVDTNFFTHSIGSHLEGIEQDMTRFLEASCHLIVTSCVMAGMCSLFMMPLTHLRTCMVLTFGPIELEKLGHKYKIALKIAREIIAQDDHSGTGHRMLQCAHKGTYADECIYDRCARNRIYLVATNDREFRKRLRKIPGVPLIAVDKEKGKYRIERLPNAPY